MANNNDIVQLQIQPEILDVDTTEVTRQVKEVFSELKNQMTDMLGKVSSTNMTKNLDSAVRKVVSTFNSATKALDAYDKQVEISQQSIENYENALGRLEDAKKRLNEFKSGFAFDEDYYKALLRDVNQRGGAQKVHDSIADPREQAQFSKNYETARNYIGHVEVLRDIIQETKDEVAEFESKLQNADDAMLKVALETTRWSGALQNLDMALAGQSADMDSTNESAEKQGQIFRATMRVVSGLGKAVRAAFSTMKSLIQRVSSVVSDLYNRFTKLFKGFTKGSKGMNFNSKKLFKTFLQFGLGVRSLYFLIRRMRTEFIKGMKQMAASFPEVNEQVSSLAMAFNQLKGSAVTMIQPILASVIPVLIRLFNVLSAVMEKVAQFFAILRGQKVIYKAAAANVDYAESVDDVGGSAKEANKELAEYDELLVIPQDSAGSGGGGGGAGSENPYGFEEVPIDAISDFAKKLKEAWESADYEEVGRVIAEKLNSVVLKISDWISNVFEPKGIEWANRISRIGNGLFEAWDAELAGKTVSDFFNAIFKIVNEFVTTFNWSQAGEKIGNAIISALNNFDAKQAGETVRKFFEGVFEAGIALFVQNPGGTFGAKLAEFINSLFDPNSGVLGGFIGGIVNNVTAFFKSVFENVDWGNLKGFLQTNFNSLADNLGFSGEMKSNIAKVAEPIFEIFQSIAEFVQKIDFEKVFGSILELLGSIASLFESVWGAIGPVLEYAINDMFPRLNESTSTLFDGISTFLDAIQPVLSPLLKIMMEIGTEITEFVNSGISGALQTVATIIKPIAKILGKVLELIQPIMERLSGVALTVFNEGLELLLSLLEPLASLLDTIFAILAPIFDLLSPILDIIIDIIELAITPLIHIIKALVYFLTGDFEAAGNEMKEMLGDMGTSVNKLKEHFTKFKDKIVEIWNKIVETITTVKDKLVEIWNTIKEKITDAVDNIKTGLLNAWENIKNGIVEKVNGIKTKITEVWTSIKTWVQNTITNIKDGVVNKFEALKTGVVNIFENLKNKMSAIWNAIWNVIKAPINWILAGVETLANGVVNGINAVIRTLNSLHFDVPDWIPLIGGKTFGFNIGYLGGVSLPRLAQGAVIPPNKEFLAVLGDQASGTNIEAPLDTIKQALVEALAEYRTAGQGDIVLQLDGKTVAKVVWSEEEKRYKQTGTFRPSYA